MPCYSTPAAPEFVEGSVHSTVEGGDQVAVGGMGGAELVVAVLEALLAVEELLFEFGYSLAQSGDFRRFG
jgi:hypothetical protein